MSFDPNAIGNRIFTLRTNAKLSQEKLAEKLGVSHRHLGDLERGSSNGSVKILIDIAEYFHVSMDYLLLGRDPSRDQFQNDHWRSEEADDKWLPDISAPDSMPSQMNPDRHALEFPDSNSRISWYGHPCR